MKPSTLCAVLLLVASSLPATAKAGIYGDDLSRCLVESTTQQDRIELVRWMFVAASLHPAVRPISTVTPEQLDDANETIANLFMDLLLDKCRAQTEKAVQYEGPSTIENAFTILGQVAGQELFMSPEVAAALAGLEEHVDEERLAEVLGGSQAGE